MRDLFTCPSCLGMSRCHAYGLRNSECHVCVRLALAVVGARSRSPRTAPDRAKGLEEDGAGPSDGGGERGIFKHKGQGQAHGPSELGDLEVTEYIARIRGGPFETRRERRICPPGND